jgi:hypothetical protein
VKLIVIIAANAHIDVDRRESAGQRGGCEQNHAEEFERRLAVAFRYAPGSDQEDTTLTTFAGYLVEEPAIYVFGN